MQWTSEHEVKLYNLSQMKWTEVKHMSDGDFYLSCEIRDDDRGANEISNQFNICDK